MNHPAFRLTLIAVLTGTLAGCGAGRAQAPPAGRAENNRNGIKPYAEVITPEAISDSGLFVAHTIGEKLYYEIPVAEYGQPYLWVSRIARAQTGTGFGGQKLGSRVVRWERNGNRVLMRNEMFEIAADSTLPIYQAVEATRFAPVIRAFPIEAFGPDSAAVIDVTGLFTSDVAEISPKERLDAEKLDEERSLVEGVRSFPDNIEVDALLTFEAKEVPEDNSLGTISVLMHHSMVRLPEEPMRPRLCDDRVGFFSIELVDYGMDVHRAEERCYVTRWRLDKRDPTADVSEPIQPIVYYIDPATPEKWIPWLKKGVESWNPAFELAGFRNAIEARDAPTPEEDPEWSPEDARYSVIRWLPSTIENASGPHVHDPRTGQILESDIQWYHNVMNLLRDWYFVQVAPLDERAQRFPLPDSLMGRLVEYVAAHEVGHTLGFPHNMKSTSSYPVDSLRSATFTARYGPEASIMDYGRFNYVAQPGDGATLIPIIAPYDRFVVEWGYTSLPEATSPDDERRLLERIVRRQDDDPMLGTEAGVCGTPPRRPRTWEPIRSRPPGSAWPTSAGSFRC